jgi:hypothetical protein
VDLYIRSSIRLHGVVLSLSTGTTLLFYIWQICVSPYSLDAQKHYIPRKGFLQFVTKKNWPYPQFHICTFSIRLCAGGNTKGNIDCTEIVSQFVSSLCIRSVSQRHLVSEIRMRTYLQHVQRTSTCVQKSTRPTTYVCKYSMYAV